MTFLWPDDARTVAALSATARNRRTDRETPREMAIIFLAQFKTPAARATLDALLHDTEVIQPVGDGKWQRGKYEHRFLAAWARETSDPDELFMRDRKSTRLNSSH